MTVPPSDPPRSDPRPIDELFAEYARTRRSDLREELIVMHLDLVSRLARQLAGRSSILDDLIQVGYIGLMKAIDRFEPSRQIAFVAYAIPTIAGEMKRYLRDKGPIIHIPRQIQEQREGVERTTDRLTQKLHRPPSDAEIAEELGWELQRVVEVRAIEFVRPVSLDRPLDSQPDEPSMLLGEAIPWDDETLGHSEDRLLLERAFDTLTPRQRAILYLLFYEDLSQAQIGERLSISQMQVSRLSRAALERLRQGLAQGGLEG